MIAMAFAWSEILENIFSDGVSGIACVIENEQEAYSYLIHEGKIEWQ